MSSKDALPKRSVTNAFLIWRVPRTMPIEYDMLLENIEKDIESAEEEHNFIYSFYARRETPKRSIKFLIQRSLLTKQNGLVMRNERTARYVARLPEKVVALVEKLSVCDPLTLLAGAGDE